MSKSKYTNMICLLTTCLTVVITVLFMLSPNLGIAAVAADAVSDFSERDLDGSWNEDTSTYINLEELEDYKSSGAYALDGNVYIISKGTYVLSGSLTNHQIIVNAQDCKVQLVLNGVTLTNEDTPPIYIKEADKVFLTLADDSINNIELCGALSETAAAADIDAAIYSKSDLSINGNGSLSVQAEECHGIKSTDDLIVTSGIVTVDAGDNALQGKDSVRICGGTFYLTAGNDGIKSNNDSDEDKGYIVILNGEFHITADYDGIQAETNVSINGGDFDITTGGGSSQALSRQDERFGGEPFRDNMSEANIPGENPDMMENASPGNDFHMPEGQDGGQMPHNGSSDMKAPGNIDAPSDDISDTSGSFKGIKAGQSLSITDGTYLINCADDALHSNGSITISGGEFSIFSGDDGIHADDTLCIKDGELTITESYEGLEANQITISGGTIAVTASDDGFNANGGNNTFGFFSARESDSEKEGGSDDPLPTLKITGGEIHVQAGGDGLDSNGDIIIEGGLIYVDGPSDNGNSAIDYGTETGGSCQITGGTILALGSSGMAETFSNTSAQCSFLYTFSTSYSEGNEMSITDSEGQTLLSYTTLKSGDTVIFSSPDLVLGNTYIITVGEQTAQITLDEISTESAKEAGMDNPRDRY